LHQFPTGGVRLGVVLQATNNPKLSICAESKINCFVDVGVRKAKTNSHQCCRVEKAVLELIVQFGDLFKRQIGTVRCVFAEVCEHLDVFEIKVRWTRF
jgi:hypothetical protein